jgi:uncharacterized protein (DUF433 family)
MAAIALSGAIVAGGATAAIAAVGKKDGRQAEQAVLDDAAKRLNVTPDKLRDALSAARDAQLDEAVKAGRLTQKQADAIKAARKQSGSVLGGPKAHLGKRFGPGGPGGPGFGVRHDLLDDIAKALKTTPAKLFEQLRAGKSLADVAKANGVSLADVRTAAKAAIKTRLDTAVKDGDLTRAQADDVLARVDDKLEAIQSGKALRPRRHGRHHAKPPAGAIRPGGLLPGDEAPRLVSPDGTFS